MKTLHDIGENTLLKMLLPTLPQNRGLVVGPGDDCAVIRIPGAKDDLLLTTDPVIEGRHFLPETPLPLVGRKAVSRAISDIAAMGGLPQYLLVNLVAPSSTPLSHIQALYRGIAQAARTFHLGIAGGDTAQGPILELHITAVGRIPRGQAILRSGAKCGNLLYVTGRLGGAYLPGSRRHLTFTPRVEAGRFLSRHRFATAMMDVSDGLATDLPRLLDASRKGIQLDLNAIPLSTAARRTTAPLHHALADGEDFELIFTISATRQKPFESAWARQFPRLAATQIGRILANPHQRNIPVGGYQHFQT
ncbi:MAG: thiamine-phosphate kinase [Verrucomicrobiota bacterium]|jgi:thiamine-monophosphate kinase|nr:thiamine-phosphate kinase [Verrucomicrobiota bacterium]